MVAILNASVPIVDKEGRPTRPMMALFNALGGPGASSIGGRVTALESSVAALTTRVGVAEVSLSAVVISAAANAAAITALQSRASALELFDVWVTPWP